MPKIKSFKSIGKHQAYDLEVDHPDHQFYLANGLLTSNSHAVSYAIDSYMCAWLLTHFESEWLCAYMETQSSHPDKRSKAIGELRAFGYEITKVDINHATKKWTIMPGKKFMPSFLTVKAVGEAAVDEIIENRPYNSVHDLLWNEDGSWKHSKFNKRAMQHLIQIGAFDSTGIVGEGKTFSNYHQMFDVLTGNDYEDSDLQLHKLKSVKKGRDVFERRLQESQGVVEWDKPTWIRQLKELVGSTDLSLIISDKVRTRLDKIGVPTIDDYKKKGLHWFILDEAIKKVTKTKKPYLLLNIMGPTGKKHRCYCWGWHPDKHPMPELNTAYMGEIDKSDFGFATTIWKIKSMTELS